MGVALKRVILETYRNTTEQGLVLCMSNEKYYINHFGGIGGTETLIDDIQTREDAKEKFLELIWDMS